MAIDISRRHMDDIGPSISMKALRTDAVHKRPLKLVLIEPKPPGYHIFSNSKLPRLGTVLLGALADQMGWIVRVYVEDIAPINYADALTASIVGISTITATATRAYAIADALCEYGVPVVMGGPHVTFLPEEALHHCDYVVRGEGEKALPSLLRTISGNESVDSVPSLSWIDENGTVRHNPLAAPVEDLDLLPYPDFNLIVGWRQSKSFGRLPIIPVQTSRGCPYGCSFCSVIPMFGRKFRFRSVDSILGELKQYSDQPHYVFFYDDNFTANRFQTKELLRRAGQMPGVLSKWSAQVRVESANDDELLSLMHKTGCSTVYIGFESANPRALEETNKHQTLDQMRKCVRRFNDHDIDIHGMFVLGMDSDTSETITGTISFAKRNGILSSQFILLTPFPGTPVYEGMKTQGRLTASDWSLYDGHHVVFKPKNMTLLELQRAQMTGHAQFYSLLRTFKQFLSGYLIGVAVYIYARHVNRKWRRGNRGYLKALKRLGGKLELPSDWNFIQAPDDIDRQIASAATTAGF